MIKKTEDRFLRIIHDTSELPLFFQEAAKSFGLYQLNDHSIYLPPQSYPIPRRFLFFNLPYVWRVTPHRLMLFKKEEIILLSSTPDTSPEFITIPLHSITDAVFSTQLLYAYLLLRWEDDSGLQEKRVEFNTVGETVIRKAFNSLWQVKIKHVSKKLNLPKADPALEINANFSPQPIPIKFHNYISYSCLPSDHVFISIFQAAVKGQGLFKPTLSPPRMVVVTESQIIFIEEDLGYASHYSVVIHYCPFESIQQIETQPDPQYSWLNFTLGKKYHSMHKTVPLAKQGAERLIEYLRKVPIQIHDNPSSP